MNIVGREEFVASYLKVIEKKMLEQLPVAAKEEEMLEKTKWISDSTIAHIVGYRVVA